MREGKPAALSLFAGCGGDTLGLVQAGFSVPAYVENWLAAARSHQSNFPDSKPIGSEVGGDIRRIPDSSFLALRGSIQLVFGGFPCQGFSHAGKKDPNDPRNRLFWEFVRVAKLVEPRWVIGENVSGLLHRLTDDGARPVSEVIVEAFTEVGFKMTPPFVLDAKDFGVPQSRRRVFFVGSRQSLPFRPPSPETRRSLIPIRGMVHFGLDGGVRVDPNDVDGGIRTWLEGEGRPEGPAHPYLIQKLGEKLLSYGRRISPFHVEVVDLDEPAKTIHSGYEFQPRLFPAMKTSEGFFIRTFRPEELARIQGFPEGFQLSGSSRDQVVQVGNAVPPGLARAVVSQVARCDPELSSRPAKRNDLRAWGESAPIPG